MAGAYTTFGCVRLAWEVGLTRLFTPGARLIRRPFYLRGGRHVDFGQRITIGRSARIEAYGSGSDVNIVFGADVQLNDHVHIASEGRIIIGDRVLIASRVFITDHNHGAYGSRPAAMRAARRIGAASQLDGSLAEHSAPTVPPADRPLSIAPVTIGDDVWLGQGVCVLPGVTIGAGSIVGANAVVATDIPPASIAAGVPARVVRRYDQEQGWVAAR